MSKQYKTFWVTEEEGNFQQKIIERSTDDLPNYDTLVQVHYSSLNYKDALSIGGHKGITKNFPHQPGIDAAGIIVETKHPTLKAGDKVIVTGYDLGMNTDGGFGEYIKVPKEWLIALPKGMSLKESMCYGTAGFTAALGLHLLERNGQKPEQGPVVVTGATGGVGSLAVSLLSNVGYEVIASTGKKATASDFLTKLGATKIVDRNFDGLHTNKLLLRTEWAGAIDTVGGNTLHTLLKACKPYGNIACCGLVQSPKLDISVYPFIINGISLLGIATAENPIEMKEFIWHQLATDWSIDNFEKHCTEIRLEQLSSSIELMQKGKLVGRTILVHENL